MYEEHLGHTATKEYICGIEPEDGQHLGCCGCGEQSSAKASMKRKRVMGTWRLRSVTIRRIRKMLPMTVTMYIVQIGMHIQIYKSSRPGIPVRTYHTSWGLV
jgi:hypothetical protein